MRKYRKLFFFITLALYTIAFTTIALANGMQTLIQLNKTYEQIDNGHIYITLQHESNPLDLPDEEQTLETFRTVYDSLRRTDLYTYYEIYRQPLDITHGFGAFYSQSARELSEDARSLCVQISENVQNDFDLSILNGRSLCEEDYTHKKEDVIPVLMGFDYSKIYEVGDTFTANYLYSTYSFEVVGFLNDNCNITLSTGAIDLNKYIIMPSFEFENSPQTAQEYVTQKIHYANKTSGKISVIQEKHDQACVYIQSIINDSGIGDYSWTSSSLAENMSRSGIDIYVALPMCIALSISFIVIALIFSIKYYCVSQENTDAPLLHIVGKKFCSLFAMLLLSIILSLLISSTCLKSLGLASLSVWGIYIGIPVVLIVEGIVIFFYYRSKAVTS